jgi:hypothetical protein
MVKCSHLGASLQGTAPFQVPLYISQSSLSSWNRRCGDQGMQGRSGPDGAQWPETWICAGLSRVRHMKETRQMKQKLAWKNAIEKV